jgi:hypothetical protein
MNLRDAIKEIPEDKVGLEKMFGKHEEFKKLTVQFNDRFISKLTGEKKKWT